MTEESVYCSNCRRRVQATVSERIAEGAVKGRNYSYRRKVVFCSECGAELTMPELEKENEGRLMDVYRQCNGILPLRVIRQIPQKYAIGKRPLSLLMGWGEQTFSRYCEGDLPSKQYSDALQKIYESPEAYAELLEKNRGNLKTAAYQKSRKAVDEILEDEAEAVSVIDAAAEYILQQCGDITPFALQKALYYYQGFFYAFYDQFIFAEDCQAWIHGPVYPEVYRRYQNYRFDQTEYISAAEQRAFSAAEKTMLQAVLRYVCCYSGNVLEEITCGERPWVSARGSIPEEMEMSTVIPKEEIGTFFKAVREKYNMVIPKDIKNYMETMFAQR